MTLNPEHSDMRSPAERWMPTPCEQHTFSSNLREMGECDVCDFRGQAIAEATSVLTGHPGLQEWEPPVLAAAILVAVGMIERAP